jgi:hypothetical protein
VLKHVDFEAGEKAFNKSMEQSGKNFEKAWDNETKHLKHQGEMQHLIDCGWTRAQAENLIGPE